MNLYIKTVIKDIQAAIHRGDYDVIDFKEYNHTFLGETDSLYSNGIRLRLNTAANNVRLVDMVINDTCIGHNYLSEWKDTPVGKFLSKDYKKNVKDINDNIIYHYINYKTLYNLEYTAIIRELVELSTDMDENTIKDYISKYGDICIDNTYYSVIKIWEKNNPSGSCATSNMGTEIDESLKVYDDNLYNIKIDENTDEPELVSQEEADNVSETLF